MGPQIPLRNVHTQHHILSSTSPIAKIFRCNWAGDMDIRRSITDYVIMLNNSTIIWKSCCQPTVILLTIELEYMVLMDTMKELKWVKIFLADLGYSNGSLNQPTNLFSDN